MTQARDLEHYRGHRVWLEYHDLGDESLAISDIRFSDEAEPADPIHPWTQRLAQSPPPASTAELADRLHLLWRDSLAALEEQGRGPPRMSEVIDWWLRIEPDAMTSCHAIHEQLMALDRSLPPPIVRAGDGRRDE